MVSRLGSKRLLGVSSVLVLETHPEFLLALVHVCFRTPKKWMFLRILYICKKTNIYIYIYVCWNSSGGNIDSIGKENSRKSH